MDSNLLGLSQFKQSSQEKRKESMNHFMEDLNLDELTKEDKFFLIQQIEDLNKNIRYCQNASPYIFEEDDGQVNRPQISHSPDLNAQAQSYQSELQQLRMGQASN